MTITNGNTRSQEYGERLRENMPKIANDLAREREAYEGALYASAAKQQRAPVYDAAMPRQHVNATPSHFEVAVRDELYALGTLLVEKNKAYGNSALDPIRVFSRSSPVEQILARIDDKLSRIRTGTDYGSEDAIVDLMGYLVLLRLAIKGVA